MGTISTTQRYYDEDDASDALSPSFPRALVVGVLYGLVAWFHVVLCAAYAVAGFVPARALASVYGTTSTTWVLAYCVTGGAMLAVAVGLVGAREWAWRIAPWAVVPSLVVHGAFIVVMPVWGAVGIACELLAVAVVLRERPLLQAYAPPSGARRFRLRRAEPSLAGSGRPT